ncbi:hypothetical protein [Hydrogenophaga atypica]|uniref:Uncharacterized protein n=1 Tax=Hydrogenophaga atypica TaxID=249409 RepID=A0ABW2QLF7_9BURK
MDEYREIFSVHESGASDSWQWIVSISRIDIVNYRLLVYQVLWESADEDEGAFYELSAFCSGAELFKFVQSVWVNDHEEKLREEDWKQIELNLRAIDHDLADQVREAVQLAFEHVEPQESSEKQQIESCIKSATWKRNIYSGGGAMWAALADGKRMEQALSDFVREHHSRHGVTPQGVHLICGKEVTFSDPTTRENFKP